MPIKLSCNCSRFMLIKDELAGRKVRCPDCGAVLIVPKSEPAAKRDSTAIAAQKGPHATPPRAADGDNVGLLPLEDCEPVSPPNEERPRPSRPVDEGLDELDIVEEADDEDDPETLRRERRWREHERAEKERERRDEERRQRRIERIERAEERNRERRKTGAAVGDHWTNAGVVGGIVMIIIAVLWFVGGLAVGYIFFYPPILALLGIGAIVRGFMNRE